MYASNIADDVSMTKDRSNGKIVDPNFISLSKQKCFQYILLIFSYQITTKHSEASIYTI